MPLDKKELLQKIHLAEDFTPLFKDKIGYDTIRLWVHENQFQHIRASLLEKGIRYKVKKKEGGYITDFYIRLCKDNKIRFKFKPNVTTISFEPAKFFNEGNYYLAGIYETRYAIETIAHVIDIPVASFKFSRLDITANMPMEYAVERYTQLFKAPAKMQYSIQYRNGNKMYSSSNRAVVVYQDEKCQGTFRIELRLKNRVSQTIKKTIKFENDATSLFDPEFYLRCVEYYEKVIRSMCKTNSKLFNEWLSSLEQEKYVSIHNLLLPEILYLKQLSDQGKKIDIGDYHQLLDDLYFVIKEVVALGGGDIDEIEHDLKSWRIRQAEDIY